MVDETMRKLRERTGTVDTLHIAVLAALNVAHRYMTHREGGGRPAGAESIAGERVRALIELVEAATAEVPGAS